MPITLVLRDVLDVAKTAREVRYILHNELAQIDGRVVKDTRRGVGLMDVLTVGEENFRCVLDHNGRLRYRPISAKEAAWKVCRIEGKTTIKGGQTQLNLHDGRTIRYPDPVINESDTVMVDIATNKITDHIKYDAGALVMITGGRNRGRVGVIQRREKHKGSVEVVHVKDAGGHEFATRSSNTFVIGEGNKPMISLPKGKGLRLTIVEELERRKEA